MNNSGCSAGTTEPFALRVIGDSMSPEFQDGNIIIIDPAVPAVHQAYVVIDYGGEILFGQYHVEEGRRWIHYLNPGYESVELVSTFEVKGVVIQRSTGRRKDLKHYSYPAKQR
ncbi:MAG: S24 family peptidase [Gammaproteobacteria bacterium]|nr:S24 family peptidase [Gammaproteobacteria bacterium]